jgi:hypothetical protein
LIYGQKKIGGHIGYFCHFDNGDTCQLYFDNTWLELSYRTRNLPVLGRWFDFEPLVWLSLSHFGVEGHPNHFWAGRAESTPFRRRRPPRPLLGQSGCAASTPVGPYLSQSAVEGSPKTLLGWSGCVYLIPASKATKITSEPVELFLSHSGVEGSPLTL